MIHEPTCPLSTDPGLRLMDEPERFCRCGAIDLEKARRLVPRLILDTSGLRAVQLHVADALAKARGLVRSW